MEHFNPLALTEEQAKNNPNKYWDGFLGQKVKLLCEVLQRTGSITDVSVTRVLDEAMEEIPKNKVVFIGFIQKAVIINFLEIIPFLKNSLTFQEITDKGLSLRRNAAKRSDGERRDLG